MENRKEQQIEKRNTIGLGDDLPPLAQLNESLLPHARSNTEIINNRKVINGEDDGLMQVHPLKHPRSYDIYQLMLKNTWMPQEVELTRDVEMWNRTDILTDRERAVYERSLAFVSNLDGIQTNNLTVNVARQITSPEMRLVVVRQAFEESLHVVSYATMIEALGLNPEKVYGLYRTDRELYNKNRYVLDSLQKIADPDFHTGSPESDRDFLEACVANIILEGIYFYSAFLFFYVLKRNNKMPGSAEMIQFINRDEDLHLEHFVYMTNTIREENPHLWTGDFKERLRRNIAGAVEMEYSWGVSCIGDGFPGLTAAALKEYIQFVGNRRLRSIDLEPLWPGATNPFPWIDELTQGNMIETNFFEGRVREYQAGGGLDWD